jgi:hypothetical protein
VKEIDIIILLNRISDNFSFHDRLLKLAEECSEFMTEYFHYSTRGDEHFDSLLEEIAGIDFVLMTLKRKIMSIPAYKDKYKEICNDQMHKAIVSVDGDILKRKVKFNGL